MPYFRAKVQKHFLTSKQNCHNFYVFNESADTLRHTKDIPKTYQRHTKDLPKTYQRQFSHSNGSNGNVKDSLRTR